MKRRGFFKALFAGAAAPLAAKAGNELAQFDLPLPTERDEAKLAAVIEDDYSDDNWSTLGCDATAGAPAYAYSDGTVLSPTGVEVHDVIRKHYATPSK